MFHEFLKEKYPEVFSLLRMQTNKFAMFWIASQSEKYADLIEHYKTTVHLCPSCKQRMEIDIDNDLVCNDCMIVTLFWPH